jgi:hypothetical protein
MSRHPLRGLAWLVASALCGLLLAACGGGSANRAPDVTAKGTKLARDGAIGLVTPHPIPPTEPADPDSMPKGGPDLSYVVRAIGKDTYTILFQNTSRVGYIDAVEYSAPPGVTIDSVTKSSAGTCALEGGHIVCSGLHLKPPACTCGVGGAAMVTFRMHVPGRPGHTRGLELAAAQIDAMTPVLWEIPSTRGALYQADLPLCKANQRGTTAHPCVPQ